MMNIQNPPKKKINWKTVLSAGCIVTAVTGLILGVTLGAQDNSLIRNLKNVSAEQQEVIEEQRKTIEKATELIDKANVVATKAMNSRDSAIEILKSIEVENIENFKDLQKVTDELANTERKLKDAGLTIEQYKNSVKTLNFVAKDALARAEEATTKLRTVQYSIGACRTHFIRDNDRLLNKNYQWVKAESAKVLLKCLEQNINK